jgi:hypothetical protein
MCTCRCRRLCLSAARWNHWAAEPFTKGGSGGGVGQVGLRAREIGLFLDVDRTLRRFAPHPDAVEVPTDLVDALSAAEQRLAGAPLALISGRPIAALDRRTRRCPQDTKRAARACSGPPETQLAARSLSGNLYRIQARQPCLSPSDGELGRREARRCSRSIGRRVLRPSSWSWGRATSCLRSGGAALTRARRSRS